jgi:RimJ/RimL family protein N-acetyltransferase
MEPAAIETERLRLDPQRVEDANEMVGVLADAGLYRFIGGRPPALEDVRDRFVQQAGGRSPDGTEEWRNWIVRQRSGVAIGTVQATLSDEGRTAVVAWVIGVPWQANGYASEAAGALVTWLLERGVRTVEANIHPEHAASEKVAQRAGFTRTDLIRDGECVWRLRAGSFEVLRPTTGEVPEE